MRSKSAAAASFSALLIALVVCGCGERVVSFSTPGATCSSDADCSSDQRCGLGQCRTRCPCQAEETCVEGQCFSTDCAGAKCAAGEVCLGDRCGDVLCGGKSIADYQSDVANCGRCGAVCQAQQADPLCVKGACTYGACRPGYIDLDPSVNGCETACAGPECGVGPVRRGMAASTSRGALSQTGNGVMHRGVLGDTTATFAPAGVVESRDGQFVHRGGFGR
ncbi:MAG: hypothetical protein HY901_12390 [Deltaproteobacteria bacterium]|nr:hypothetical protein [Deltaproteobacteria bacterium]